MAAYSGWKLLRTTLSRSVSDRVCAFRVAVRSFCLGNADIACTAMLLNSPPDHFLNSFIESVQAFHEGTVSDLICIILSKEYSPRYLLSKETSSIFR